MFIDVNGIFAVFVIFALASIACGIVNLTVEKLCNMIHKNLFEKVYDFVYLIFCISILLYVFGLPAFFMYRIIFY